MNFVYYLYYKRSKNVCVCTDSLYTEARFYIYIYLKAIIVQNIFY